MVIELYFWYETCINVGIKDFPLNNKGNWSILQGSANLGGF